MNPEKSVQRAKNVGRDGTGKRNDESQEGVNEPPTAISVKAAGRKVVLKRSKDIA